MSNAESAPTFIVGDAVRVKAGVADPDFPDVPYGGWAGTIAQIENGTPRAYLIVLNERTLKSVHPIYRTRCERDGLEFDQVWLLEDDLEPDIGEPAEIEQPTSIITRPLNMADQGDRIRSVLGLTSDDLLPSPDEASLLTYYDYLAAKLSFPFEAKYTMETGPLRSKSYSITVLGLLDPRDFPSEEYGLFCQARRDRDRIELPLSEVEVGKRNANRRLVEDYSYWFVNC